MPSGSIFRFTPPSGSPTRHLFIFLHGGGATARSMIPVAFDFRARFPSAALVVPNGLEPHSSSGAAENWIQMAGLNDDNRASRVASALPAVEFLIRREQAASAVPAARTVLIGFSQGGMVALEAVKSIPDLAGAVVGYASRFARLPAAGSRIDARIHLVHGAFDAIVSRVHAERAARVLGALHVPVTLDIIDDLGHALNHPAICRGSLRLLQGIYERRRAPLQ